jgi:hypothetical protein
MRKLVLAAGLLFSALLPVSAQDFNPGTVVGNVFQNPLSGCGCGYGQGCCPPDHGQDHRFAYHHRAPRRGHHDATAQH